MIDWTNAWSTEPFKRQILLKMVFFLNADLFLRTSLRGGIKGEYQFGYWSQSCEGALQRSKNGPVHLWIRAGVQNTRQSSSPPPVIGGYTSLFYSWLLSCVSWPCWRCRITASFQILALYFTWRYLQLYRLCSKLWTMTAYVLCMGRLVMLLNLWKRICSPV